MRASAVAAVVFASHAWTIHAASVGEAPRELHQWFAPQQWQRDTDGPILSLGEPGRFDDTHIFAPAAAHEKDRFLFWYCGSRGSVADRVFRIGFATSLDGKRFEKHGTGPVLEFKDKERSILTPALLRKPDGSALRENGKLRMWFSSTSFHDPSGLHTLHEASSEDGLQWSDPSPAQLSNAYAPTILKTGRSYQMWYTDVSQDPWIIRRADSEDGRRWETTPEPALELDQDWESGRLFYPTVVRSGGAHLMWCRKEPPSANKYCAINTARWRGPEAETAALRSPAMPPNRTNNLR